MPTEKDYLISVKKLFLYYKALGEKAIGQVDESQLFHQSNEDSNSIATIIEHLAGNMLSRWIDPLTTDGEKPWRNRDEEFVNKIISKDQLLEKWQQGWTCFFHALDSFSDLDLNTIIYIRNEGQSLMEAINRQLAHYPYHIGQIIYIAKELKTTAWNTLSIARNQSTQYNSDKFSQEKTVKNFTEK